MLWADTIGESAVRLGAAEPVSLYVRVSRLECVEATDGTLRLEAVERIEPPSRGYMLTSTSKSEFMMLPLQPNCLFCVEWDTSFPNSDEPGLPLSGQQQSVYVHTLAPLELHRLCDVEVCSATVNWVRPEERWLPLLQKHATSSLLRRGTPAETASLTIRCAIDASQPITNLTVHFCGSSSVHGVYVQCQEQFSSSPSHAAQPSCTLSFREPNMPSRCTFRDLQPHTLYGLRVRSWDAVSGFGGWSAESFFATLAVEDVELTNSSPTELHFERRRKPQEELLEAAFGKGAQSPKLLQGPADIYANVVRCKVSIRATWHDNPHHMAQCKAEAEQTEQALRISNVHLRCLSSSAPQQQSGSVPSAVFDVIGSIGTELSLEPTRPFAPTDGGVSGVMLPSCDPEEQAASWRRRGEMLYILHMQRRRKENIEAKLAAEVVWERTLPLDRKWVDCVVPGLKADTAYQVEFTTERGSPERETPELNTTLIPCRTAKRGDDEAPDEFIDAEPESNSSSWRLPTPSSGAAAAIVQLDQQALSELLLTNLCNYVTIESTAATSITLSWSPVNLRDVAAHIVELQRGSDVAQQHATQLLEEYRISQLQSSLEERRIRFEYAIYVCEGPQPPPDAARQLNELPATGGKRHFTARVRRAIQRLGGVIAAFLSGSAFDPSVELPQQQPRIQVGAMEWRTRTFRTTFTATNLRPNTIYWVWMQQYCVVDAVWHAMSAPVRCCTADVPKLIISRFPLSDVLTQRLCCTITVGEIEKLEQQESDGFLPNHNFSHSQSTTVTLQVTALRLTRKDSANPPAPRTIVRSLQDVRANGITITGLPPNCLYTLQVKKQVESVTEQEAWSEPCIVLLRCLSITLSDVVSDVLHVTVDVPTYLPPADGTASLHCAPTAHALLLRGALGKAIKHALTPKENSFSIEIAQDDRVIIQAVEARCFDNDVEGAEAAFSQCWAAEKATLSITRTCSLLPGQIHEDHATLYLVLADVLTKSRWSTDIIHTDLFVSTRLRQALQEECCTLLSELLKEDEMHRQATIDKNNEQTVAETVVEAELVSLQPRKEAGGKADFMAEHRIARWMNYNDALAECDGSDVKVWRPKIQSNLLNMGNLKPGGVYCVRVRPLVWSSSAGTTDSFGAWSRRVVFVTPRKLQMKLDDLCEHAFATSWMRVAAPVAALGLHSIIGDAAPAAASMLSAEKSSSSEHSVNIGELMSLSSNSKGGKDCFVLQLFRSIVNPQFLVCVKSHKEAAKQNGCRYFVVQASTFSISGLNSDAPYSVKAAQLPWGAVCPQNEYSPESLKAALGGIDFSGIAWSEYCLYLRTVPSVVFSLSLRDEAACVLSLQRRAPTAAAHPPACDEDGTPTKEVGLDTVLAIIAVQVRILVGHSPSAQADARRATLVPFPSLERQVEANEYWKSITERNGILWSSPAAPESSLVPFHQSEADIEPIRADGSGWLIINFLPRISSQQQINLQLKQQRRSQNGALGVLQMDYVIKGLKSGTTYELQARTASSEAESHVTPWCDRLKFVTRSAPVLRIVQVLDNTVEVAWSPPPDGDEDVTQNPIAGYELEVVSPMLFSQSLNKQESPVDFSCGVGTTTLKSTDGEFITDGVGKTFRLTHLVRQLSCQEAEEHGYTMTLHWLLAGSTGCCLIRALHGNSSKGPPSIVLLFHTIPPLAVSPVFVGERWATLRVERSGGNPADVTAEASQLLANRFVESALPHFDGALQSCNSLLKQTTKKVVFGKPSEILSCEFLVRQKRDGRPELGSVVEQIAGTSLHCVYNLTPASLYAISARTTQRRTNEVQLSMDEGGAGAGWCLPCECETLPVASTQVLSQGTDFIEVLVQKFIPQHIPKKWVCAADCHCVCLAGDEGGGSTHVQLSLCASVPHRIIFSNLAAACSYSLRLKEVVPVEQMTLSAESTRLLREEKETGLRNGVWHTTTMVCTSPLPPPIPSLYECDQGTVALCWSGEEGQRSSVENFVNSAFGNTSSPIAVVASASDVDVEALDGSHVVDSFHRHHIAAILMSPPPLSLITDSGQSCELHRVEASDSYCHCKYNAPQMFYRTEVASISRHLGTATVGGFAVFARCELPFARASLLGDVKVGVVGSTHGRAAPASALKDISRVVFRTCVEVYSDIGAPAPLVVSQYTPMYCFTPPRPLGPPRELHCVALGGTAARFAWRPPNDASIHNQLNHVVELCRVSCGDEWSVAARVRHRCECVLANLFIGERYKLRITCYSSYGRGGTTNSLCFTTRNVLCSDIDGQEAVDLSGTLIMPNELKCPYPCDTRYDAAPPPCPTPFHALCLCGAPADTLPVVVPPIASQAPRSLFSIVSLRGTPEGQSSHKPQPPPGVPSLAATAVTPPPFLRQHLRSEPTRTE